MLASPTPRSTEDSLGDRIRRARLARHLTQAELARRIGLRAQTNISGYESGSVELSARLVPAIATALGTTVAALYGEAPDPNVDLVDTPTRTLIAGIDVSDLNEHDRMEIAGVVAYLAAIRRQRAAQQTT